MTSHLCQYMLAKLPEPIREGIGYKYLGSSKIRIPRGWITVPDPNHVENVAKRLGLDGIKAAQTTPGVKRSKMQVEEDLGQYGDSTEFRSLVGSLTHATKEIEVIAFPTKELSRKLSDPQIEDWMDLRRLVRFMHGKSEWGTTQTVDETSGNLATIVVTGDSNWAGDENGLSTTAVRVTIDSFKVGHLSQTQPGLPALSSGEGELRALTRGAVIGMHLKMMLEDLGYTVKLIFECDSTAALEAASKMSSGRMLHLVAADTFIRRILKAKQGVAKACLEGSFGYLVAEDRLGASRCVLSACWAEACEQDCGLEIRS